MKKSQPMSTAIYLSPEVDSLSLLSFGGVCALHVELVLLSRRVLAVWVLVRLHAVVGAEFTAAAESSRCCGEGAEGRGGCEARLESDVGRDSAVEGEEFGRG